MPLPTCGPSCCMRRWASGPCGRPAGWITTSIISWHGRCWGFPVLVSDGLLVDGPGWVAKQLELSAAAGEPPEQIAKTLVETARVRAQKTGRPDDITAAVLRLEKCV